jgi:hypothetical protein
MMSSGQLFPNPKTPKPGKTMYVNEWLFFGSLALIAVALVFGR